MTLKQGYIFVTPDGYPRLMEVINPGDGLDVNTEFSATIKIPVPVGTQLRGIWEDLPGMEPYTDEQKAKKRAELYTVQPDGSKKSFTSPEAE